METIGYYSIIQYSPSIKRCEGINCGIAVIVPDLKYIDIKFSDEVYRISATFENKHPSVIKAQLKVAEKTILSQKDKLFKDESYLYLPVKPFSDVKFLTLTQFKFHDLKDLKKTQEDLYCELVYSGDSQLTQSIKILLSRIKENLFFLDKHGPLKDNDVLTFSRAHTLFEAADAVRDIIDE